ncbi:MAG: DUF6541 family protein [Caldilineaceae bacterium]
MQFQRLKSYLPNLTALLLLIGLPPLVFWQVWTPNSSDRVMFGGDILMGAYPTRIFVHRLFELGRLPLWNPYQLGGMPLLGDVQVAPYYWPNLLLDWLYRGRDLPYISFELLVIAHYALGAIFLYAYLRELDVTVAAALIGAIGFEFNGFFVGHRGHYNMLAVAAWLPGVLWLLERSWRAQWSGRAVTWAVIAGLALSQMVMAGHPQATLYCTLTVIAYFFYRWWRVLRHPETRDWRARLSVPALFSLAGVIGAGVAAVALLPAAELLGRSLRSNPSYNFAAQFSLLPRNLIGLLMPEFLGWSGTEFRIYAGVFTLVLTTVVWFVPLRSRPERGFFSAAAILALITALGGFTVLHGIIYRFVPGFTSIRVSTRAFYIANLSLSVLAAFGVEGLLGVLVKMELRRLRSMARAGGILLGILVLLGAGLYVFLLRSYQPVNDTFFFAENLFSHQPAKDAFGLLTQTANAYLMFVLLLAASVALLWARTAERLRGRWLVVAAALLMFVDVATFAPYHDTIKADPEKVHFTIRDYATTLLNADWQVEDQQQMIDRLNRLADGVRIDNSDEVLPDNYSAVYQTPFATGYNILDLQDRFQLFTQWPKLNTAVRYNLLNIGYVLTAPPGAAPAKAAATPAKDATATAQAKPDPDGKVILENSQGKLWATTQQPSYAHFSTRIRPVTTSIAINGLLNTGQPLDAQPTIAIDKGQLGATLQEAWPEAVAPALYQIGKTGVQSPVDISVLAGGPLHYSTIIVAGVAVTPQQRGIVLALIDPQSGEVLNATAFDTYVSEDESNRLAAALSAAPAGAIVALATYDEGLAKLNAAARTALASLGAKVDLTGKVGAAYALIGVKGSQSGAALEQLDQQQAVVLDIGTGALASQATPSFTSKLLVYEPERISLSVQNNTRGLLSISEAVYPGWEAYVDGEPTPILRANGLLRAVIVPPVEDGKPHEVTFVYQPLSVRLGSALSIFTLAVAFSLVFALTVLAVARMLQHSPALGLVEPKLLLENSGQ